MKITCVLVVSLVVVAIAAPLERRKGLKLNQEKNGLEELVMDESKDKQQSFSSSSLTPCPSNFAMNERSSKKGVKRTTHNRMHRRYSGLRRGRPLIGHKSGLSHTSKRKTFSAGIRGPLGTAGIHATSYNRGFVLKHRK